MEINKIITRQTYPLALLTIALLVVGCASRGEIETMQRQLDYLERSSSQTQDRLMSLDSLFRLTIDKNVTYQADLKVALDQVLDQMDIINGRLTDMERRVNDLAETQGLTTSRPSRTTQPQQNPPTTRQEETSSETPAEPDTSAIATTTQQEPALPQIDKQKMFDNAFDDLRAGNFELAKMGFEEYIKLFPDTPITDDAQYWLAECFYGNNEYAEAIPQFEAVAEKYPQSDKLPPALFKLARSYEQTNQVARAVQEYERIVDEFPNTFEAERAAAKLAELRDESR